MKSLIKLCWRGVCFVFASGWTLLLWSSWLALALVLAAQIWLISTREIALPGFALRAIETRLESTGLHATFGRAVIDPGGRVLIENVRLVSPSSTEPLVTVGTVYIELDPWALLAGGFEPRSLQLGNVNLYVPAMLSASGRTEPIVRNLEASLVPHEHQLEIRQFNARMGALFVTARGALPISVWGQGRGRPLPIVDFISRDYPRLSREVAGYLGRLALLQDPELHIDLDASEGGTALISAAAFARGLTLEQPTLSVAASNLEANVRLAFANRTFTATQVDASAGEVRLPRGIVIRDIQAQVRGQLRTEQRTFEAADADIRASQIEMAGQTLAVAPLSAHVLLPPRGSAALRGSVVARLGDAPADLAGEADPGKQTAAVHVAGQVTPAVLDAALAFIGVASRFPVTLSKPASIEADVRLDPGWKPLAADARISVDSLVVRNVPVSSFSGHVSLNGTTLLGTDLVLHQGENVARGSYMMDTLTRDYRFLLTGRLRPLDINGWFSAWWPQLFSNFDFAAALPDSDVDVQGRWGSPALSTTFVGVNAIRPVIRTVPFDRVHTVLWIPHSVTEAREFTVWRGAGKASGTFTRSYDSEAGAFREMDFDATSTLEVQESARAFGQQGLDIVEPFRFATPPQLRIKGHLEGPASPSGVHQTVHIEGESKGAFELYSFPLANVSFTADVHDDVIAVDRAEVDVDGGHGAGRVRLSGRGANRRLSFDYALRNLSLGQAITTLENYSAFRRKSAPPEKNAFAEKAADIRLDFKAAAEGVPEDIHSYHGAGEAELSGELLQIPLLSVLTDMIPVASLRFTKLQTPVRIEGPQLVFQSLKITGANSAIEADGTYAMDRDDLDFKARVYPFQESKGLFQSVAGAVLLPLSEILEVKLTGPLRKYKWEFVSGPNSILRSLLGAPVAEPPAGTTAAPPPTPAPATPSP